MLFRLFLIALLALHSFTCLVAAASEHLTSAWDICAKAVKDDDLAAFKRTFSPQLLQTFVPVPVRTTIPTHAFVDLASLVAASKKPHAAAMMIHMINLGLDPNRTRIIPFQEFQVEADPEGEITRIMAGRGQIQLEYPLDIAVFTGNVHIVEVLLSAGANPYDTTVFGEQASFFKFLLKRWVSVRFGENPLMHALSCLEAVEQGRSLPASPTEYQQIAELLSQAQMQADIDACSLQ